LYRLRPWGRTKTADLKRLKKDLGGIALRDLTAHHISTYFRARCDGGTGGVTISAQVGYLVAVLKAGRVVFNLDTSLQAARDARAALSEIKLIKKSKRRDRRVTDDEISLLIEYLRRADSQVEMPRTRAWLQGHRQSEAPPGLSVPEGRFRKACSA
jgi:hypothetical protein